jgi:hypothetical protein
MARKSRSGKTVYVKVMEALFERHDASHCDSFNWSREEIREIADDLGVSVPKNLGDNIYSIRHGREALPENILDMAAPRHWLLLPAGKGKYKFLKGKAANFSPDLSLQGIKIPNSTPQIVEKYALGDEQAVLARIRYNRLIDIFLGITAAPLQSHLRTTVSYFDQSQIETDELYVGVDRKGAQYVIPVQAKGDREIVGAVQAIQDIRCCAEKFPNLICKALAAQTIKKERMSDGQEIYTIAMIELAIDPGTDVDVSKVQEKHYVLTKNSEISDDELKQYREATDVVG